MGNRTQRVDSVAGTTTYGYDAANRLTDLNGIHDAYVNDADGNTLSGGGRTNTWDVQDRLVQSVTSGHTSAFSYGSDGLRHSSLVDGNLTTCYAYDGQMLVREMQQNVQGQYQTTATYLNSPRGSEYRRDDVHGSVRWYVYDGQSNVMGELDPNGNLTAGKKYDVYGGLRSGGTGTSSTRHQFCGSLGHVTDQETGLVYMRARYYDPNIGRFISEDPDAQGSNWYVYVDSSPVNAIDATGKEKVPFLKALWDMGWWEVGSMFTVAAICFMTSKTVPGFKNAIARSNNAAFGCASLAIICFACGSVGMAQDFNLLWWTNILAGVAAAGPAIYMFVKMGEAMPTRGGMGAGVCTVAVAAAITDSFVTLGYLFSIGVDVPN